MRVLLLGVGLVIIGLLLGTASYLLLVLTAFGKFSCKHVLVSRRLVLVQVGTLA